MGYSYQKCKKWGGGGGVGGGGSSVTEFVSEIRCPKGHLKILKKACDSGHDSVRLSKNIANKSLKCNFLSV